MVGVVEHSWGGRGGLLNRPIAPPRPRKNALESCAGIPGAGRAGTGVLNRPITPPRPFKDAPESRAEHSWGG